GPLSNPKNFHLKDLNRRETTVLAPLVLMIFVIGLFPSIFIDRMRPSVEGFVDRYTEVWRETSNVTAPYLLPPSSDPAMGRGAPYAGGTTASAQAEAK